MCKIVTVDHIFGLCDAAAPFSPDLAAVLQMQYSLTQVTSRKAERSDPWPPSPTSCYILFILCILQRRRRKGVVPLGSRTQI